MKKTFDEICEIEPDLRWIEGQVQQCVRPLDQPHHYFCKKFKSRFIWLVGFWCKKKEIQNVLDYSTVYEHLETIYYTRPVVTGDGGLKEEERKKRALRREMAGQKAKEDANRMKLYFMQCEKTRCIKIGISKNPKSRVRQLQTGNPSKIKLLKIVRDASPMETEKELHRKLKEYKTTGEWYKPEAEVFNCVRQYGGQPL